MEIAPHARRRKACDLCTTKRIRCDGLKPTCSNCRQYGVECKMTVKGPAKPATARTAANGSIRKSTTSTNENPRMRDMEDRLTQIEDVMRRAATSPGGAQQTAGSCKCTASSTNIQGRTPPESSSSLDGDGTDSDAAPTWGQPSRLQLPPLEQMLPALESYFDHFNPVLPLFQKFEFMKMLQGWHYQKSHAEWAAINVALALSCRIIGGLSMEQEPLATCIANVKSSVMQMMQRSEDVMGLQVLLGLIILYQGTPRTSFHKEIPVLMGAAARLAQVLRLHLRDDTNHVSPLLALRRNRLFWIVYILDKDTSMRFRLPSLLLDDDIEQAPPLQKPHDEVGNISTLDDQTSFNIFQSRVQLAYIQGRSFDLLWSARSRSITTDEKKKRAARLQNMLTYWYIKIPAALTPENLANNLSGAALQHMIALFNTQLVCTIVIHGLHWEHTAIIARIRRYNAKESLGDALEPTLDLGQPQNPLPAGWAQCVTESRACLKLAGAAQRPDYYIWHDSCSSFPAGLILLLNLVECPDHEEAESDQRMIDSATEMFNHLIEYGPGEKNTLRSDFFSLGTKARAAVSRSAQQGLGSLEVPMDVFNPLTSHAWDATQETFDTNYDASLNQVLTNLSNFEQEVDLALGDGVITDSWDYLQFDSR